MQEKATVIKSAAGVITVQSQVKSTCHSCAQSEQCVTGQVAKTFPHRQLNIEIHTPLSLNNGDEVTLALSDKHILLTAWQVYLWPIFGLIIGAMIGQWLIDSAMMEHEAISIALGFLGGFLGFKLAKYKQCAMEQQNSQWLRPKIVQINGETIPVTLINEDKTN